jgi:alpha-glucosidase
MLSLYGKLLRLRKEHAALSQGSYRGVPAQGNLLLYVRESGADRLLIALNFASAPASFTAPPGRANVLLSTAPTRLSESHGATIELGADEGIILALSPQATA